MILVYLERNSIKRSELMYRPLDKELDAMLIALMIVMCSGVLLCVAHELCSRTPETLGRPGLPQQFGISEF